jgi:hypothetical protein
MIIKVKRHKRESEIIHENGEILDTLSSAAK